MPQTEVVQVLQARPEAVVRYEQARDRRRKAASLAGRTYYADPVAFGHDCFQWPEGEGPTEYQDEVLDAVPREKKVAVRSLHGAGKTTINSIAVLWFAVTRDLAGADWKCPTTAGAWRQLEQYLWPEIHKWARLMRWERLGRDPFTRTELLKLNLNLSTGSAFAVASDVPAYIEGVHADEVMYVYDEAKSIPEPTFDASEGAFSGTGQAFALAASTPGEPNGRFHAIQSRRPGYEDWHPIHISLERAVASGRVKQSWADLRKIQWGEGSALYANRVLGEFHSADEDSVIPLSWLEAAVDRWHEGSEWELEELDAVGVDVARSGSDSTVQALRYGVRVEEIRVTNLEDTMATTGRVGGVLVANPKAVAIVDTDGLGAGVTDRLREQGFSVVAFHAGAKTEMRDRSGELGFLNVRAAAWWKMREALDPAHGSTLELPPDDTLLSDLTAPHWKIASNSRIQIESKDDIKKRIGRSTDRGDAVVQSYWEDTVKKKRRMTHAGRAR